ALSPTNPIRTDTGPRETSALALHDALPTSSASSSGQLVNGAATISDTATLSGGSNPQGTITFTATGPGGFTCTQSVPVSGNGTYGPAPCAVTQAGAYTSSATYTSSDANNTQP